MNRTQEGLFVGLALVVLTVAVLYGVQSLLIRPATTGASPSPVVVTVPPRQAVPAPTPVRERPDPAPSLPAATPDPVPSPTPSAPVAVPAEPPVVPARPISPPVAPAVPAAPAPAPAPTPDPLARGRELTGLLYGERLDELWAAFLPAVRADWRNLADFRAYRRSGLEAYGAETRVLGERVTRDGGLTYYTRTATFERGPREGWTLIFGLDSRGRVQEFGIVEAGGT